MRRAHSAARGRLPAGPTTGRRAVVTTTRLPVVDTGVVVLERSGARCRALAARVERGELAVERRVATPGVEWGSDELARGAVASVLRELDVPYRDVVVVTDRARPEVVYGDRSPRSGAFPLDRSRRAVGWVLRRAVRPQGASRCLLSSVAFRRRAFWGRTLRGAGCTLQGIYPLAGAVLPGLLLDRRDHPSLLVQVERDRIALIEALEESCLGIELHDGPPDAERCVELIGEACPEVLLCGGGADLSELGYHVVRSSQTWVRLPRPRHVGPPLDRSYAAMIGAARHALRLTAPDAVACVPGYGS